MIFIGIMRLFVAAFIPSEIQKELKKHVDSGPVLKGIRWIPSVSLHMTLKFLGETDQVPEISKQLEAVVGGVREFELRLEGGGVFPSENNPKVFWTGLGGAVQALIEVATAVDSRLVSLGFVREERAYAPHLTVARARSLSSLERPLVSSQFCTLFAQFQSSMFTIDHIYLVESLLGSTGAVYKKARSFPLRPR